MMGRPPEYSPLLKFAGNVLKYYLLSWLCFAVVCIVLAGLGAFEVIAFLVATVAQFLLRLVVFIFCLVVVGAVAEAWKHW
nr:MAG: hypothetical protein EDM05_23165 [Leptolyngbya sp. IPPAS B-1204]